MSKNKNTKSPNPHKNEIPDGLNFNEKDKRLTIWDIQVKNLDFLKFLPNVEIVNLDDKKIKNIDGLKHLTNLKELILCNLSAKDFNVLTKLKNLQKLTIDFENIKFNTPVLQKLSNIKRLNLYDFRDRNTFFLKNLSNIEELYVSNVENIDNLKYLNNLKKLTIFYTEKIINSEFFNELPNVEELEFNECLSIDLSLIENLHKLKSLKIIKSKISKIGNIEKNKNLKFLVFIKTRGYFLHKIKYPQNLISLTIINNNINQIDFLNKLRNIRYIDFSDSKLPKKRPLSTDIQRVAHLSSTYSISFRRQRIWKLFLNYKKFSALFKDAEFPCDYNYSNKFSTDKNLNIIGLNLHINSEQEIPHLITDMKFLRYLSLKSNNFKTLKNLEKLKNLRHLDLSFIKLTNKELQHIPSKIRLLYLRKNLITSLHPLIHLKNLKLLDIRETLISDLKELSDFKELTHLFISYKQLENIEILYELPKLKKLYVRYGHNKYKTFSGRNEIRNFVEEFKHSENKIPCISDEGALQLYCIKNKLAFQLIYHKNTVRIHSDRPMVSYKLNEDKRITFLHFYSLDFKKFPEFIKNLEKLKDLRFEYVDIKEFDKLPILKHLKKFVFNDTNLTELPDLSGFKNLKHLDIGYNSLIKLPSGLSKLKNLKYINAGSNSITNLPPGLSKLKNLKELNIFRNKIKDLSPLVNLEKLRKLNIRETAIESIEPIVNLRLRYLDISKTRTFDISKISKIKTLKILYAEDCNISKADFLTHLPKLKYLYLSENKIENCDFISKLKKLKFIEISNNPAEDYYYAYKANIQNGEVYSFYSLRNNIKFLPYPFNKQDLHIILSKYFWILSDSKFLLDFMKFNFEFLNDMYKNCDFNSFTTIPYSYFFDFIDKEKIAHYSKKYPLEIFLLPFVELNVSEKDFLYCIEDLIEDFKIDLCSYQLDEYGIEYEKNYCEKCKFGENKYNCPISKKRSYYWEKPNEDEIEKMLERLEIIHKVYLTNKEKIDKIYELCKK